MRRHLLWVCLLGLAAGTGAFGRAGHSPLRPFRNAPPGPHRNPPPRAGGKVVPPPASKPLFRPAPPVASDQGTTPEGTLTDLPLDALTIQPPPAPPTPIPSLPRNTRLDLTGPIPPALAARAAHVEIQVGTTVGAMPRLWSGVALISGPNGSPPDSPALTSLTSILRQSAQWGARLARVRPFDAPGSVTAAPDGTPIVQWETPDALMHAAGQSKIGVIGELSPNPALSPAAWRAFVEAVVRRYGRDPKINLARWELAVASSDADAYPAFARTVRALAPTVPVGLRWTDAGLTVGLPSLDAWLAGGRTPLDSLAWSVGFQPDNAIATLSDVRQDLRPLASLRGLALLPILPAPDADAEPDATRAAAGRLTLLARWLDAKTNSAANPLLGALLPLSVSGEGGNDPRASLTALSLLNRVAGTRLLARSDRPGVHALAARTAKGALAALLWRDDNDPQTVLARARFKGLDGPGRSRLDGWRFVQYGMSGAVGGALANGAALSTGLTPQAVADVPSGEMASLELPLLLPPHAVTLVELRPRRPAPLEITLSAPRLVWNGGETLTLNVTVRNNGSASQRADLQLSGTLSALTPSGLAPVRLGLLPPGQSRAVRLKLRTPIVASDTDAALNVRAGADSQASQRVQIASPLGVRLMTPRLDLDAPDGQATARLQLTNRGLTPLALVARMEGSAAPGLPFVLPANGKPVLRDVIVRAPTADPGVVSVPLVIEMESAGGGSGAKPAARVYVRVGTPLRCRFAPSPPRLDGDLQEWAQADPVRLNRAKSEVVMGENGNFSAYAYTQWDAKYLYLGVATTEEGAGEKSRAKGAEETIRFAVAPGGGAPARVFSLSQDANGNARVQALRAVGPAGMLAAVAPVAGSMAVARQDGAHGYYEAALPWAALNLASPQPDTTLALAVAIGRRAGRGRALWGDALQNAPVLITLPPLRLVR